MKAGVGVKSDFVMNGDRGVRFAIYSDLSIDSILKPGPTGEMS